MKRHIKECGKRYGIYLIIGLISIQFYDAYSSELYKMISVLGILIGSGICSFSSSIYMFLIGNMILNFSNSLDIHNFYIIEQIPKNHQGKMRGMTGGIAALAISGTVLMVMKHGLRVEVDGEE